jgi:uncharacterized protein YpmS
MNKNFIKMLILALLSIFSINTSFAQIEDNQIIDALDKKENFKISDNFTLKTFSSCEDLNSVMEKYIKTYWKLNKNKYSINYYR